MKHSMKKVLVVAALGTVLAAPASAQQAPSPRRDAQALQWSSRVHVYAPDFYQPQYGNQNANPDFQLGGSTR
jgi:opacity protein-like surface antigen